MDISLQETLYIVLIFFTTIVWTLLSIVLYKLLKVLNTLTEIVELYNTVKSVLWLYSQIPEMLFWFLKDFILWNKK